MIQINKLKKSYGKLTVLNEMDIHIRPGVVTAVLGPNGAGKTTLIKSILGLVKPDSGTIKVGGEIINGDADYRNKIGYMPQLARYPENLNVREIVDMIRDIRQFSGKEDAALIQEFNLEKEWEKPFKTLSGGNRQKVSAVLAFLFDPNILFLDEPTAGLDPIASSKLKDKILTAKKLGKTIILTSHVLSEVHELADHIVYLLDGKIRFEESVDVLLQNTGQATLERAIATMIKGNAA